MNSVVEWCWSNLHEEIIPSKKITKMRLTFLQSSTHLGPRSFELPSEESLQIRDFDPQSSPHMK